MFLDPAVLCVVLALAPVQHHQPSYNRGNNHHYNPPVNPQFQHHKQGFEQPHGRPLVSFDNKHWDRTKDYNHKYGNKFKYGYYYKGYNHNHWDHCHWDKRYGCYLYHDPCCQKWYYWCAPHYCYYPVEYYPCKTYVFPYQAQPCPPEGFVQPAVPMQDDE